MCVGVKATAADIKKGFKKAFAEPWPERLRYEVGESYPSHLAFIALPFFNLEHVKNIGSLQFA